MSKWVEGHVVGKRCWTDELFSLQVDAPVEPFRAGQFTKLALDIDGERIGRPYSFVNSPQQTPLEFYFISVPHGPLTERLMRLEPGDTIWLAPRAAGFFTLNEVGDGEKLWLLSTGTALGVFLSLLRTPDPWQRFPKIVLVHAARTVAELTYREEIQNLVDEHSGQFQYVPFVSREEYEPALRGRIPQAIEDGRLETRVGLRIDAADSQVMICGNPAMVRDTIAILEKRGLKKNRRSQPGQITTESYW